MPSVHIQSWIPAFAGMTTRGLARKVARGGAMGWMGKLLFPRRGDGALVLAGLFLLGCAVLPSTFLIDWTINSYGYEELAGPVSTSVVAGLAGLGNSFAVWLVFSAASKLNRVLTTIVLGLLAGGCFWFGVRCAAFDPWHFSETAIVRCLPSFWIVSVGVFAAIRLVGVLAVRIQSHPKQSSRRSPVIWLGIPFAVVLWLIHTVSQSGMIKVDADSIQVPYELRMVLMPILFLSILPGVVLVVVRDRFAQILILVAYFALLSFLGSQMDFPGQFELTFMYAVTFVAGTLAIRRKDKVRMPTSGGAARAPTPRRLAVGPFSGTVSAIVIASLAYGGWFLTSYDLASLIGLPGSARWQIAELNRGWVQTLGRARPIPMVSFHRFTPQYLSIRRRMTVREWKLISQVPVQSVSMDSLSSADFEPTAALPTGVQFIQLSRCELDSDFSRLFARLPSLANLSFEEMHVERYQIAPLRTCPSLAFVMFHRCNLEEGIIRDLSQMQSVERVSLPLCNGNTLWKEISQLEASSRPLKIGYGGADVVPAEQVRLKRQSNIDLGSYGWSAQAIAKGKAGGSIDWASLAQHIDRDANGEIVRLDLSGIDLENDGLEAIGQLTHLVWLGVSTHDWNWFHSINTRPKANVYGYEPFDYTPITRLSLLRHARVEASDNPLWNVYEFREKISDDASLLGVLSQMPSIESLEVELPSSEMRALCLRVLPRFQNLIKLTLKCYELEVADLKDVIGLPKLQELVICSPIEVLSIDDEQDQLKQMAPNLVLRRQPVERFGWPADGDKIEDKK